MEDLIFDPRRFLYHNVRRRTLRRVSATCIASTRICHHRQLVGRRGALTWGALAGITTAVGVGFTVWAQWTANMPRKRLVATSGSPIANRVRARRNPVKPGVAGHDDAGQPPSPPIVD